ncbi:ABC transporter ATP-binding protein [Pelosinus sp. IPA-1]|uniref:ABC transporter ATP-binding protein n=1 Tax=Pelosinus sp. IPA-1 TaxID=3029569 RepID=UPI00243617AC|nr:ABC transporter ATP-binding protein [Pelosinus sp. IPA-1]GMA97641.1 ABC transporter ATP-binding protein [Pelosinus sp. IPA-1]
MELLKIANLTKKFGGLTAVDRLSLSIEKNTITGLIGPNGAGKTTVFNLLTGFYQANSGSILFNGQNITNYPTHKVAEAGLVRTFQNIRLFTKMTTFDNVRIGYHSQGCAGLLGALSRNFLTKREETEIADYSLELLAKVGLADKKDELAGNLSYGMQRKLEIARALAAKPSMLLLDEPAAGMNPHETRDLMKFIQQLASENITIVLIEHDMKLVMNVCQKIVVLDYGIKIAEGLPAEIHSHEGVMEAYLGKGTLECLK